MPKLKSAFSNLCKTSLMKYPMRCRQVVNSNIYSHYAYNRNHVECSGGGGVEVRVEVLQLHFPDLVLLAQASRGSCAISNQLLAGKQT